MFSRMFRTISMSSLIATIVLGISLTLVVLLLLNVKRQSDTAALETAENFFSEIAAKNIAKIEIVVESISELSQTAALTFNGPNESNPQEGLLHDFKIMKVMLDENATLMSSYIGYNDGAFHQVISPRENAQILKTYDAPPETAYIDRIITVQKDGKRNQQWRFLDSDLNILSTRADDGVDYDPRKRPWYQDATKKNISVYTDPYVFSSSKVLGITCAHILNDNSGVFGVDVSLAQLSEVLASQKVSQNGTLWILDAANHIVAYPGLNLVRSSGENLQLLRADEFANPLVRAVAQAASGKTSEDLRKPFYLHIDGQAYLSTLTSMPQKSGLKLYVVVAAPLEDITGYISRMVFRVVLLSAGILLLTIPLTILVAKRVVHPVTMLAREAKKIQGFDFSPSSEIQSNINEVQSLASATKVMKEIIKTKTESLISTQSKLEMLVEGGLALSAEKDMARLVTLIFQTAKDIAKADGGVMYLYEGDELGVELLAIQAKSLMLGGLSDAPAPRVKVRPEIGDLLDPDSVLFHACEAFNNKQIVTVRNTNLILFPTGLPKEPEDYHINSLIAVPIVTRRDEILGVIQLFNADLEDGQIAGTAGNNPVTDFISSLAAQAAVTLDNRNLVKSLRELFD
ncbi:MAG: cache domain-containing protein, partial [Desulfuromonadaceae bacterium]|nr:cache domain-containing protein [Desulfuromonadaceae bacterium]